MLGVFGVKQAIEKARDAGLDLVEISPNAEPPVCKILDYGKYKYEKQKKANEAKKKQKTVDVKEIKLRPAIGDHDYEVKLKAARKFIENGDKLKVTLRFRGREMAHMELGMEVVNRLRDDLADIAKVDQHAKTEGRQILMVMSPDTGK
jgi:translation initiation factor IF-3